MFTLTKWIAPPAMAVGLLFAADAPEAKAQYGGYGDFCYGIGVRVGGGHYGHYGYRVPSYGSHYRYGVSARRPWYHDTTHYDYHPPEVYRHRNHYHVQPGHYDLHRSGHWHH